MNVRLIPDHATGQGNSAGEMAPTELLSLSANLEAGAPSSTPPGNRNPAEPQEVAPEQLAALAKAGRLDSFEQLVLRYENQIFNFLRQFTGNHHDAEDLTQETFLKAYRGLHRYNASLSFAAWLFTIARRTAASHFRSAHRLEELDLDEQNTQENPATALESKDERRSLWSLVRKLNPKQSEALWLRYGEGFSVAETARIMRTNQIHVKVLLHRARGNLSTLLGRLGFHAQGRTVLRGHRAATAPKREQLKALL